MNRPQIVRKNGKNIFEDSKSYREALTEVLREVNDRSTLPVKIGHAYHGENEEKIEKLQFAPKPVGAIVRFLSEAGEVVIGGYPTDECAYHIVSIVLKDDTYDFFGMRVGMAAKKAVNVLKKAGFKEKMEGPHRIFEKNGISFFVEEKDDCIKSLECDVETFYLGNISY